MWTGGFVENCEGSEILLYLNSSKLTCHSFMDTGRKYEIPGLEMRDNVFFIAITLVRVSAFLHWFHIPSS